MYIVSRLLLAVVSLLLFSLVFAEEKVRYDNYIHVEFEAHVENDLRKFRNDMLELEEDEGLRLITAKSFLLPPASAGKYSSICADYNLKCKVATHNFQSVLDWEERLNNEARKANKAPGASMQFFQQYNNLAEFNTFLSQLETQFPQLVIGTVFSIGKSVQGRDINGIRFTGLKNRGSAKPVIIYNAGQHAREWIAPATVAYIAYELLSNYSQNPAITEIMDNFEWVIIPIVNPDGFNYTWTDRMWRKNRRINAGSTCLGVDNNRNWDYMWLTGGSSTNPCSETFAGPVAFSEPEEKALALYINSRSNVVGYIDFHAAAYLFLNPYGYTAKQPPNNAQQWQLAEEFVVALYKVHGKSYVYGNIMNVLYQASGSSTDYVYHVSKVYYTYTIELREGSPNVFILPPAQIIPNCQEVMAGVIAMAKCITAHPPPKSNTLDSSS